MPRDPLTVMLRLRQRTVDEARLALAGAVAGETGATAMLRAVERSIETESDRASDPCGDDDLVETFARWLPAARDRVSQARKEQERWAVEVARTRAELAAARTGLEVIETMLREKRDAAAREEAKRSQQAIDEAGSRRSALNTTPAGP